MKITEQKFKEATGFDAENDDIERCNCNQAGTFAHEYCGWCSVCDKPIMICGHKLKYSDEIAK